MSIVFFENNAGEGRSQAGNSSGICINEVCSSYFPISFSETQPPSDWIELYNFSDTNINLGEYYLSDDKDDLDKCSLPPVVLSPGSYYVIHSKCDEMAEEEAYLNFRVSARGETLYLSGQAKGVIDVVDVPAMDTNTTWSRMPDAGGSWGNTEQTYQASNTQEELVQESIEEPVFSADGGFYADAFELELKASSESRIYYTIDGSEPDSDSILYEKPIQIRDVSNEPNVYSERNDFNADQNSLAENPVEKIMVVRAIAIDEDGKKSNIVTNSYIIGRENQQNYKEMYAVSLVTDPYNLFDYDEGIYVLGKRFDEYIDEGGDLEDSIQAGANYRIRGKNRNVWQVLKYSMRMENAFLIKKSVFEFMVVQQEDVPKKVYLFLHVKCMTERIPSKDFLGKIRRYINSFFIQTEMGRSSRIL